MKTAVSASALFGAAAMATAVPRQAASQNLDPTVLNFALTLEHLENTYYKQALSKFTAADFKAAGAPDAFYKDLQYIAYDESTHVKELSDALTKAGVTPVKECTYKFPYTDAKSFLGLTTIIEGVGTSAYLGGAPLITSKDYLTAAGSILVSEALHTSLLRSTSGLVPNANPNGTPLDPTSVYSIVTPFFDKCPSDNPALPFKAYPAASGPSAALNQGDSCTLKLANGTAPQGANLVFVSGLAVTSVPGTIQGGSISAAVPKEASGQTYVLVTKGAVSGAAALNATTVVAGPAVIEVNPAPVLNAGKSNGTSTGGSSTGGAAGAPAPATSGSRNGTSGSGSGSGSGSTGSGSGSASSPAKNAGSKLAVGGASFVAVVAAALLL